MLAGGAVGAAWSLARVALAAPREPGDWWTVVGALAGGLFFGAVLLVTLWSLTIASGTSYFSGFNQLWIPLLVWAGVLGVVGLLRGLLDSWLYLRIKGKKP